MSAAILRRTGTVWNWIGTAVASCILIWAFRNVNLAQLRALIDRLHSRIWLIPLPFAIAQLTETAAWQATFRELGCAVRYSALLRIRLACEGIVQTIPGGMLLAETVKPALLMGECNLTVSDAVCGGAARKFLLLLSQCGYFALAVALGTPALRRVVHDSGYAWLPAMVLAAWLVLLLAACGFWVVIRGGRVCQSILSILGAIPVDWVRSVAQKWSTSFRTTDARIIDFCNLGPRRMVRPLIVYFMAWCCEAMETLLLLRLLGVQLDWRTLFLVEVCASMIRHLAFVSPAGLGIQDVGYAALLRVFGIADWLGVAAAFTLLKRGKEIVWSLIGYGLLANMQMKRTKQATGGLSGVTSSPLSLGFNVPGFDETTAPR